MAKRTTSISITVKLEQKSELLKESKKKNMPISEIVRNAIDSYLSNKPAKEG